MGCVESKPEPNLVNAAVKPAKSFVADLPVMDSTKSAQRDQQQGPLLEMKSRGLLPADHPAAPAHEEGIKEVETVLRRLTAEAKASGQASPSRLPRMDSLKITTPGTISPDEALIRLMVGHHRFLQGESAHPHQSQRWMQLLAETQRPFAAVLSCSDSRVPPEMVFDVGFGDVFVCRVAGNIATNEEIGSLEYSVVDLGVSIILVLGHAKCGACKTALKGGIFPGYIDILVDALGVPVERACTMCGGTPKARPAFSYELLESVVKENISYQIERLLRSSVLNAAVNEGKLKIVGGYYNLESGHVALMEV